MRLLLLFDISNGTPKFRRMSCGLLYSKATINTLSDSFYLGESMNVSKFFLS